MLRSVARRARLPAFSCLSTDLGLAILSLRPSSYLQTGFCNPEGNDNDTMGFNMIERRPNYRLFLEKALGVEGAGGDYYRE